MGRGGFCVGGTVVTSFLVVLAGLLGFAAKPALAGLQVYSGDLASCAGGGFSVDLVVTGTVTDVAASQTSSRVEIRVDQVLLGDRDKSGETLFVRTDSGTNGGNSAAVSFREGARYELYLQGEGDEWKTNICLGTRELTEPPRAVASVPGAGASANSPVMPETGGPSLSAFAALGGIVLAVIGARFRWRKRCGE